jgi:hypothetical protein
VKHTQAGQAEFVVCDHTIHDRYRRWCQEGRFAAMLVALRETLDAQGRLDWEQWWVDSTSLRASRAAAGARKKGGQKPSLPTTL